MLTTEIITENSEEINLIELQVQPFDIEDSTNEATDMDVSMKLIDEKGETIMLIEAIPYDMFSTDDELATKGCFIKRVVYDSALVNTQSWDDFFKSFITAVRYKMIPCNNNRFMAYYNYIWSRKSKDEQCVIAELFQMKQISDIDGVVTYKIGLKN